MRVNTLTLTAQVIAIVGLVKVCHGGPERMQAMYKELVDQMPMSNLRIKTGSDKGILEFQVPTLDGYGCWCRISNETFGTGKGTGVDPFDDLCYDLHRATECLMFDYHEDCNPWTTDYNFAVGIFQVDCANANPDDDCKKNLCRVEANFVMAVLHLSTSFTVLPMNHGLYNPNAPQYTGEWDYDLCGNQGHFANDTEEEKPTKESLIDQPHAVNFTQQCCGQYPIRYPFRDQTFDVDDVLITDRSCCDFDNGDYGTTVFDKDKLMCCDGTVSQIGSCVN